MIETTKNILAAVVPLYMLIGMFSFIETASFRKGTFFFFFWPLALLVTIYRGAVEFFKGV